MGSNDDKYVAELPFCNLVLEIDKSRDVAANRHIQYKSQEELEEYAIKSLGLTGENTKVLLELRNWHLFLKELVGRYR